MHHFVADARWDERAVIRVAPDWALVVQQDARRRPCQRPRTIHARVCWVQVARRQALRRPALRGKALQYLHSFVVELLGNASFGEAHELEARQTRLYDTALLARVEPECSLQRGPPRRGLTVCRRHSR